MAVKAERSLIGGACCQRENAVTLLARPLFTRLSQRFADTLPLCMLIGHQLSNISLTSTGKVGAMGNRCKAKAVALLILCNENHGLRSMLIDALCNPTPSCFGHLLCIAPRRYADGKARGKTEDKLFIR